MDDLQRFAELEQHGNIMLADEIAEALADKADDFVAFQGEFNLVGL